ncbi:MAG: glycosyltransferase [Bacteroidales bacterium]|jgi:glycosyltransferase involved in cell wall biosynthesis|nr:glycosyltransferase [Bacteroidales bacterium]
MSQPKISVCIATYNGEQFILEQIISILTQLTANDEVIISDDNSTDNTLNIIRDLNDSRIRIYINTGKKGYSSNFENALRQATGDYIFLSDQDDIWKNNKIQMCIKYLKYYDFIVSDATVINMKNEVLYDSFFSMRNPHKTLLGNLFKFGYLGCCFACRKNVINKSLPFPANHKLATHDNWIFLIALMFFKIKILDEKLIFYKRHTFNISTGGFVNKTTFGFKIKYRLYLIFSLLKRSIVCI